LIRATSCRTRDCGSEWWCGSGSVSHRAKCVA
jgi:hypothetical protein